MLNVADLTAFEVLVASILTTLLADSFLSLLTSLFVFLPLNLSPSPSHLIFSSKEEIFSCVVFHRLGRTSGGQLVQLSAQSQDSSVVRSGCSGPCVAEF